MREDSTAALARLQRQFLAADRLTLLLATLAGRDRFRGAAWDSLETTDRMVASCAMGSALRLASTWVNLHIGELATQLDRYAVADAVAGEDLREVMPEVAAGLRAAWPLALEVRAQVRQLGPEAEEVAQRIAPSWRADLRDLVFTVAAVTQKGHTR